MHLQENQTFENLIEELQKRREETETKLQKKQEEIEEKKRSLSTLYQDSRKEFHKAISEEKERLSPDTLTLLQKREAYKQKLKRCKWFGICVALVYGIIVFAISSNLNPETYNPFIHYLGLCILGILLGVSATSFKKKPIQQEIKKINSDADVMAFDKKFDELWNSQAYNKNKNCISELEKEATEIQEELWQIKSDLFNITYRDTLLFYGSDKSYRYQIYLDGHLYDEVIGKRIVSIKLSEGIHSFKLESISYNPVDHSIINAYTFSTRQIIIEAQKAEVSAYICDGRNISQVTGLEFERVTKQTLI